MVTPPPQVLLGEVTSGMGSTQVVVKELKASASVQDQMHFLEEAQPYRWWHWHLGAGVAGGGGGAGEVGGASGRGRGHKGKLRAALCPSLAPQSRPLPAPHTLLPQV